MRYQEEDHSSAPLRWTEEEEEVEDALSDVVVPHEGQRDDDGDENGDGDGSRRSGRAA